MLKRTLLAALAVLATMLVVATSAAAVEPALSWSTPQIVGPDTIIDVDCPTTGLCVAVDASGNVITSTDPTGPAASWRAEDVIDSSLQAVSCASPSLCVAVSTAGNLVTSTNPAGGAAAWTTTNVNGAAYMGAVDCAVDLCAALDANGQIITSTNPTGGSAAWSVTDLQGSGSLFLSAIDCPSGGLCVAVGSEPHNLGGGFFVQENVVVTATSPTGGVGAWTKSYLSFRSYMRAISCPTTSFCLIVDKWGNAWSSTSPTGGEAAWSERFIDSKEDLTDVSCPSPSLCVALDESGQVLTSTSPTADMEAWGVTTVPSGINSLSCPSPALCLAAGLQQVVSGTPPSSRNQPPDPKPPAATPIYPASFFLPPRALKIKDGAVKMILTCLGPYVCTGTAKLEVMMRKGAKASARRAYQLIGRSALFFIYGQEEIAIVLSKAGRRLFETKKQARARVRIVGYAAAGQPLFLQRFATLKKRG